MTTENRDTLDKWHSLDGLMAWQLDLALFSAIRVSALPYKHEETSYRKLHDDVKHRMKRLHRNPLKSHSAAKGARKRREFLIGAHQCLHWQIHVRNSQSLRRWAMHLIFISFVLPTEVIRSCLESYGGLQLLQRPDPCFAGETRV